MLTHYVAFEAQKHIDGRRATVCREWVSMAEHSTEPTCPACQAWIGSDEAALQALLAMPPGPRLTLPPDNHLDGYSVRSRR